MRQTEVEEVLGYHLEQAFRHRTEVRGMDDVSRGLAVRGGRQLAAAGRRAVARGDAPAAVNLLERAGALLPEEAPERLELRIELADALHEAGQLQRVGELLEEALSRAEELGDAGLEARARLELACLRPFVDPETAALDDILEAAEHAAEVFERLGDDVGLARSLRRIADTHWLRCRVGPGEPLLQRALELAERAGDERELFEIRQALIRSAAVGPMPVGAAVERCEEILADAGRDPLTEAVASNALGYLHAMGGRFLEAHELTDRSRAVVEDLGLTLTLPTLDAWAGQVEMLAGNPSGAEHLWRRAYQTLEGLGEKGNLSTIAAFLADALYSLDRDADALKLTEISEATASVDDVTSHIAWRMVRAKVVARWATRGRREPRARGCFAGRGDGLAEPSRRGVRCASGGDRREPGGATRHGCAEQALAVYEAKGNVAAAGALRRALSPAVTGGTTSVIADVRPPRPARRGRYARRSVAPRDMATPRSRSPRDRRIEAAEVVDQLRQP